MFDKDIHYALKDIQVFLGNNFVSTESNRCGNELSIFINTKTHDIDKKTINQMCSKMNRLFEIDFPKDNINQFMIHLRGVQNNVRF